MGSVWSVAAAEDDHDHATDEEPQRDQAEPGDRDPSEGEPRCRC